MRSDQSDGMMLSQRQTMGDSMGVQGVLGELGMEHGWTRGQDETRES